LKIIALYNVKGGVGKTSAAVNLAYLSSVCHLKTLLWDLDSQGASTYCLYGDEIGLRLKDWIKGNISITDHIIKTRYKNLYLLPSDFSLRHMDSYLSGLNKSKHRIYDSINALKGKYNVVFLDCPPGISKLAENIFYSADIILMPIIPSTLSLNSFQLVSKFLERKGFQAHKLVPFFSMVDSRRKMHKDSILELRKQLATICQHFIPYLADIEKMSNTRRPVPFLMPGSKAAKAYLDLWNEIMGFAGMGHSHLELHALHERK
jgi:cellulose biosynthesis protein BcsQ